AQRGNVGLTFEVDGSPTVMMDSRALKQILLNLLSNAVKFTPPGGMVTLNAAAALDRTISVVVADTGIGIAPEDHQRIFEPFRRGNASISRTHEGTGLGLAITKHLIELSGGRLSLDSELGRGTTVTVRLPAAQSASPAKVAEIALTA